MACSTACPGSGWQISARAINLMLSSRDLPAWLWSYQALEGACHSTVLHQDASAFSNAFGGVNIGGATFALPVPLLLPCDCWPVRPPSWPQAANSSSPRLCLTVQTRPPCTSTDLQTYMVWRCMCIGSCDMRAAMQQSAMTDVRAVTTSTAQQHIIADSPQADSRSEFAQATRLHHGILSMIHLQSAC